MYFFVCVCVWWGGGGNVHRESCMLNHIIQVLEEMM